MTFTTQNEFRKALLPKWVRFSCWLFLIVGLVMPLIPIVGLFRARPTQFSLFGWEHLGSPFDWQSILIMLYLICSGIAAFGLLWGKRWGWAAGMTVGLVGLALALSFMVMRPLLVTSQDTTGISVRLEPFLQIPFLFILWRRRKRWLTDDVPADAAPPGASQPTGHS